jgi:hypothetical protein
MAQVYFPFFVYSVIIFGIKSVFVGMAENFKFGKKIIKEYNFVNSSSIG